MTTQADGSVLLTPLQVISHIGWNPIWLKPYHSRHKQGEPI